MLKDHVSGTAWRLRKKDAIQVFCVKFQKLDVLNSRFDSIFKRTTLTHVCNNN